MEASKVLQNSFPSDNNSTTINAGASDHFIVEDLLDFSNDDAIIVDATFDSVTGNSTDFSSVTAVDSCNSSLSGGDLNFVTDIASRNLSNGSSSGDFCVPHDDLAELEWLSSFVEESFSSEDLQKLQLISGVKTPNDAASEPREFHLMEPNRNSPIFNREVCVPAKARSKRTRGPPRNWTSRLLILSPTMTSSEPDLMVPPLTPATTAVPVTGKKPAKAAPKKQDDGDGGGDGRKCLHCSTDKTPQWRTGPMGPKTLCNACGVRYKSGRLVPEYRPAASPTFVLTKHSNSHRKVLELRRQKEMVRVQQYHQQQFLQHHQNMMFDVTNVDDYLIHQHAGPDFRQLI